MLLHASMNTFKKWFAEVIEILKQFHSNWHMNETRGKTFGRSNIQPYL